MRIELEMDIAASAAYIRLSDQTVAKSVELGDAFLVDLDEFDVAVGIEALDLSVELPFTDLVDRFHIHTDVVELLRKIRPGVAQFVSMTQGTEGSTTASSPNIANTEA